MSTHTKDLTDQINDELTKAYIGGLLDGCGSLTVNVRKKKEYAFGFTLEPELSVTKANPHSIQILDDWTAENGIYGSASMYNDRYVFRMNKAQNIRRFLELVRPYFKDRGDLVNLLFEEILPLLEHGKHRESKEDFVQIMELVDELRSLDIKSKTPKYDADYFREEWDTE